LHTADIRGLVRGKSADEVFATIGDFEKYPEYGQSIRSIEVRQRDDGNIESSWDVDFRGGSMQWTETDKVDEANHRIDFEQTAGNLRHFDGYWQVTDQDGGAQVQFWAQFEIGMPTLASFIDPIAEVTIRDNIGAVLQGLFGEAYEPLPAAPAGA
jgi:ribosome-associated toxin RatA of RatAB toxin-antitoxin module